jgi:hypothetical protein
VEEFQDEDVKEEVKTAEIKEAVKTESEVKQHPIEAVIDAWFIECIHDSPASRDTQIFNHVMDAKERLKAKIKGVLDSDGQHI